LSDDKKAAAIHRGQRAQSLLDDPLFQEVFSELEADLVERWKSASSADTREECWRMLDCVAKFKAKFYGIAASGRLIQQLENRNV